MTRLDQASQTMSGVARTFRLDSLVTEPQHFALHRPEQNFATRGAADRRTMRVAEPQVARNPATNAARVTLLEAGVALRYAAVAFQI
jgi:hypothetical protein